MKTQNPFRRTIKHRSRLTPQTNAASWRAKVLFGFACWLVLGATSLVCVQAQQRRSSPILLQSQVVSVSFELDGRYEIYHLRLRLEFTNTGTKPTILLLGTYGEKNEWWVRDVWLSRSLQDAVSGKPFSSRSMEPANSRSLPKWDGLRRRLLKSTPPPTLTHTIKPNETYVQFMETFVAVSDKDKIARSSAIWLQLALELWPTSIEQTGGRTENNFGDLLARKWNRSGELWRDPVLSVPIRLDLSEYQIAGKRR